jgi:hypothetical protein
MQNRYAISFQDSRVPPKLHPQPQPTDQSRLDGIHRSHAASSDCRHRPTHPGDRHTHRRWRPFAHAQSVASAIATLNSAKAARTPTSSGSGPTVPRYRPHRRRRTNTLRRLTRHPHEPSQARPARCVTFHGRADRYRRAGPSRRRARGDPPPDPLSPTSAGFVWHTGSGLSRSIAVLRSEVGQDGQDAAVGVVGLG